MAGQRRGMTTALLGVRRPASITGRTRLRGSAALPIAQREARAALFLADGGRRSSDAPATPPRATRVVLFAALDPPGRRRSRERGSRGRRGEGSGT